MPARDLRARLANAGDMMRALARPDDWRDIPRSDVLLVCHDADRSVRCRGRAYSPLLDSVGEDLQRLGLRCSRFALPFSSVAGEAAEGSPVTANRRLFRAMAWHRLRTSRQGRGCTARSPSVDVYRDLLERCGCSAAITIGAPRALCRAGRESGVPVVELLHGLGYGFVPWGWAAAPKSDLPVGILSFDTVSTRTFSSLSDRDVWVSQIAHPWLKRFTRGSDLPCGFAADPIAPPSYTSRVLVSLQWGYDGEDPDLAGIIENGILPRAVETAIERTRDSVFWLLRLHPLQAGRKRYRHHVSYVEGLAKKHPNCEVDRASAMPLPLVLQECSGHLTMSSMTTYEAAHCGVPTLLLCPTLRSGGAYESYFRDLLATGHAAMGNADAAAVSAWAERTRSVAPLAQAAADSMEVVMERILGTNVGRA